MAVTTLYGAKIMTNMVANPRVMAAPGVAGGRVRIWSDSLETGAADSVGSLYVMARVPSSLRLMGASKISHDALGATTGNLDIGVYNLPGESNFTNDADAINDGIVSSTAGDKNFIKDRANWGKQVWEFVNGLTEDPRCEVDLKIALTETDLSAGSGTITWEIVGTMD